MSTICDQAHKDKKKQNKKRKKALKQAIIHILGKEYEKFLSWENDLYVLPTCSPNWQLEFWVTGTGYMLGGIGSCATKKHYRTSWSLRCNVCNNITRTGKEDSIWLTKKDDLLDIIAYKHRSCKTCVSKMYEETNSDTPSWWYKIRGKKGE